MAGRILGMGDVLTLIEKAQDTVDQEAAAAAAEQMLQGQFNLEDFLDAAARDAEARSDPGPAEDAAGRAGRQGAA